MWGLVGYGVTWMGVGLKIGRWELGIRAGTASGIDEGKDTRFFVVKIGCFSQISSCPLCSIGHLPQMRR